MLPVSYIDDEMTSHLIISGFVEQKADIRGEPVSARRLRGCISVLEESSPFRSRAGGFDIARGCREGTGE